MRAVLTRLSESRCRTNSPVRLWLAVISWRYKQPKTHLNVGTKKPARPLFPLELAL
jgi:hypothetical protein